MKNQSKKCSSKDHEEIDAISYCQICQIFMCNKCDNIHLKLCQNHCPYNLNQDIKNIFTGICNEDNHSIHLEYYCKNHNKLCCAACISKIKGKGNGQHTDCNVYFIEEIKKEKKNKLKENIKLLENLSNSFNQSINELKKLFEIIENNKEALKLKVQKIFTKIRNVLKEREDELLFEIDNIFQNLYFNKDFIKEGEGLPEKIKISLENGKKIDKDWNNDKLKLMINNCIVIENNISYIKDIDKLLKKYNSIKYDIKFTPENNEFEEFLKKIKNFGKINNLNQNWIESNIICSLNDRETLNNWISTNACISSTLLYRLSRDGDSLNKYHQLCDNIKNNLIIIETKDKNMFGCFCTWEWNTSGADVIIENDTLFFLFNLTKKQKYCNQKLKYHKGCENHGPYIHDNFYFDKTMKNCIVLSNKFLDKTGNCDIKEVEIYQIIFEKK